MAKAQAPTLTVSDAELTPGGFATFVITSTVDASEFSAYQFDVVLPEFAEEPTKSGNNWVYEVNGTKKNALSFKRTYFAFDYDDDNEKVYLHQYGCNFIGSGDDPTAKKIFRAIIYDGTTNSNFLKDKTIKITLNFKVKDDIKPGKYEVTVENAKFATSGGEGGVATGASIAECVAGYGTYSASTTITYSLKAEYGTLILPFAAELPEGLTAYSCAKVEGNVLTLDEVESLAANTPYIIGGTVGNYEFTGAPIPSDATLTAGLLTGVLEDTDAPAGSYVLQNNTNGLGFYKVGSVIPTVKAYRCYLTYAGEASALMYRFGGTTNISNIEAEGNNAMYDILGRKVVGPAQKGVYILNGKKVFVK